MGVDITKNRKSLTLIQLNDSHAYFNPHQEMFWQGGKAVYRLAGGHARVATIVKQIGAGQRIQQVFVGDDRLQSGRHYPTAFVTEQGVAHKYGRNRQQHTESIIEAMSANLARHRPLRAEIRGTFVAV